LVTPGSAKIRDIALPMPGALHATGDPVSSKRRLSQLQNQIMGVALSTHGLVITGPDP
jgi:hypothetical protein